MAGRPVGKQAAGRPRGGITQFVRDLLVAFPLDSTARLRQAVVAQFGYSATVDRHFPQLVWKVKKELGLLKKSPQPK